VPSGYKRLKAYSFGKLMGFFPFDHDKNYIVGIRDKDSCPSYSQDVGRTSPLSVDPPQLKISHWAAVSFLQLIHRILPLSF
jgi:hypothetical protein